MMRFKLPPAVLVLAVCAFCWTSKAMASCTGSNPTWTSTPDQSSVTTCVNNAADGATINVTAGSATWSGRIDIPGTKSISIIGAGAGNTIITNGSFNDRATGSPWKGSRISGFTFHINSSTYFIFEGVTGFRLDHNTIDQSSWTAGIWMLGSLVGGVSAQGPEGLIDHNNLSNIRIIVDGEYTDTGGNQRWVEPLNEGTVHAVYIEDNIACQGTLPCVPGTPSNSINNFVDGNLGGKAVVRFNTMYNTYLEWHSIQGQNIRAARLMEAYDNTENMNLTGFVRTGFFRGGTGMVFDNTFNGDWHSPNFDLDNVRTCHANHDGDFPTWGFCDGTGLVDSNSDSSGHLCRDQPGASTDASFWSGYSGAGPAQQRAPWYFFNNKTTFGGSNEVPANLTTANCENGTQSSKLAQQIAFDRDVYNFSSSFNGSSGVGRGTLASRPATCTVGVGYWATDQGEWNSLHAGADGELFTCTATNTWTLTYIPFTYPHPLQAGGGGNQQPEPPTGLQATVQ